ncbi:MAG: fumarate reductase subunit C [bacterium]|jgi:fumarate reductase subunit C
MLDIRLYVLQRLTALVIAPLTLVHIGVMIYAIQGGLSASEILGRTQDSIFWFLFYGLFVISVSIHAAIGMRVIIAETFKVGGLLLNAISWGMLLLSLYMGALAVLAVTQS